VLTEDSFDDFAVLVGHPRVLWIENGLEELGEHTVLKEVAHSVLGDDRLHVYLKGLPQRNRHFLIPAWILRVWHHNLDRVLRYVDAESVQDNVLLEDRAELISDVDLSRARLFDLGNPLREALIEKLLETALHGVEVVSHESLRRMLPTGLVCLIVSRREDKPVLHPVLESSPVRVVLVKHGRLGGEQLLDHLWVRAVHHEAKWLHHSCELAVFCVEHVQTKLLEPLLENPDPGPAKSLGTFSSCLAIGLVLRQVANEEAIGTGQDLDTLLGVELEARQGDQVLVEEPSYESQAGS